VAIFGAAQIRAERTPTLETELKRRTADPSRRLRPRSRSGARAGPSRGVHAPRFRRVARQRDRRTPGREHARKGSDRRGGPWRESLRQLIERQLERIELRLGTADRELTRAQDFAVSVEAYCQFQPDSKPRDSSMTTTTSAYLAVSQNLPRYQAMTATERLNPRPRITRPISAA
jgi:hypothetical protein